MIKEEFLTLSKNNRYIPVYRELMADVFTPVSLFYAMRKSTSFPFLLESVEGGEQVARYSFLGYNPYQRLVFKNNKTTLIQAKKEVVLEEPYFEALKRLSAERKVAEVHQLPKLSGGAVGFSSYDTIREVEDIPDTGQDDLNVDDAHWAFYDRIFAFDHVKHRIVLIHTIDTECYESMDKTWDVAMDVLDEMESHVYENVEVNALLDIYKDQLTSNITEERFTTMVEKAKEYIHEGDIFQVVLSQRFSVPFSGDKFMLYRALRMVNPSPYLFFLDFQDYALIGSSPEVLVSVQESEARVLPIAGTRKRGATPEEDLALEKDLMADPKENAEHIMLVDLGRNDLSRVCESGTVKVQKQQYVERYSHVMHIVSDVTGKLKAELSPVDALMQCFPAGTVSGAPKIRAMQIIDELEPTRRGPYAGAVGYFDNKGNMDTCIAIRTMVAKNDRVYIQAGAGIVADSVPHKEFEETENKAGALVDALDVALKLS